MNGNTERKWTPKEEVMSWVKGMKPTKYLDYTLITNLMH